MPSASGPRSAGDLRLDIERRRPRLCSGQPGLAHSGLISDRLRGVLRSRTFTIENRYMHWLVAGHGARINVVVDGFEKIRDPIYGGLTVDVNDGDQPRWVTQDVGMWLGHTAYLEIADGPIARFRRGHDADRRWPWASSRSTRSACRTSPRRQRSRPRRRGADRDRHRS